METLIVKGSVGPDYHEMVKRMGKKVVPLTGAEGVLDPLARPEPPPRR